MRVRNRMEFAVMGLLALCLLAQVAPAHGAMLSAGAASGSALPNQRLQPNGAAGHSILGKVITTQDLPVAEIEVLVEIEGAELGAEVRIL